jgi:integrase
VAKTQGARARQRFLSDHQTGLQSLLNEFFEWYGQEARPGFTKATVSAWRVALEARGLGSVSINVRITAVRKLAVEAADNGLLAPELAGGIARVKGVGSKGVRVGNWLSLRQAQALLNAPDVGTKKGLRDRAMLAVLLGCGLRRSEVAALTLKHIQQRDNRRCIVDLAGKHGRVRTIPMPTWAKMAIDAWTTAACLAEGFVFRPINRGDQVCGERLSDLAVPSPVCRGCGHPRHRAARRAPNLRQTVPGRRRRVGADSVTAGTRIRADDRAVSGDETGSCACAQ